MIWFETHATSLDNEAAIASGQSDAPLSELGERQAVELGTRYPGITSVWCSDLERSYRTAVIAFGLRTDIRRDPRLREVDFGVHSGTPIAHIEATRAQYIDTPYPSGESYRQVCERVHHFLDDLPHGTEPTLIIGHRATWYALEHLLAGRQLAEIVSFPWRWQPGWKYRALFS